MATLYYFAAGEEEKRFQESSHREEYKAYAQAVGRFLPRPLARHSSASPRR
jgi:protein-S-isoprenylcysteine O-methyltransferase Ste14